MSSSRVCRSFGTARSLRVRTEGSAVNNLSNRRICAGVGCRLLILQSIRMSVTATNTDIKDSILEAIGHTPLVRLSRIAAGVTPQVVAKVESLNPGGSIKDRVAVALI